MNSEKDPCNQRGLKEPIEGKVCSSSQGGTGSDVVVNQLHSLSYKCQLFARFIEKKRQQQSSQLIRAERARVKRLERYRITKLNQQAKALNHAKGSDRVTESNRVDAEYPDCVLQPSMDEISVTQSSEGYGKKCKLNSWKSLVDGLSSCTSDQQSCSGDVIEGTLLDATASYLPDRLTSTPLKELEPGLAVGVLSATKYDAEESCTSGVNRAGPGVGIVQSVMRIEHVEPMAGSHTDVVMSQFGDETTGTCVSKPKAGQNVDSLVHVTTAVGLTVSHDAVGQQVSRPVDQPALLTGGILRSYQLEGYRWLKLMYQCGISAILADEMGLGKTIQCLALICHLVSQRLRGPFLVCAPVSAIPNWVSEIKRFCPKIPFLVYHGTETKRAEQRAAFYKEPKRIHRKLEASPVVITTYDLVMYDRHFLGPVPWHLIVVDEGHRIKNLNCRLFRELSSFKSPVKLLLTGTPMQNSFSDICSLLAFLIPELKTEIIRLQSNMKLQLNEQVPGVYDSCTDLQTSVSLIHQIISPFMLRRLKADVGLSVPPKKEVMISAVLTPHQQQLYKILLDRASKLRDKAFSNEVGRSQCCAENHEISDGCGSSADVSVESRIGSTQMKLKRASSRLENATAKRFLADSTNTKPTIVEQRDCHEGSEMHGNVERCLLNSTACDGDSNGMQAINQAVSNMGMNCNQLNNIVLELRRCCNHPYLVGEVPDYQADEKLVLSSGKLAVLDRMLHQLHSQSHRVLIFCQLIEMLDILQRYCEFRRFTYCRLDGDMALHDRADVNPQWDIQAQDRCHRIGQTKPVVVYRLVSPGTVDENILKRAEAKSKLEKLVIHKDKFKYGLDDGATIPVDELLAVLKHVGETKPLKATDDSNDLGRLLDRTDLEQQWLLQRRASAD